MDSRVGSLEGIEAANRQKAIEESALANAYQTLIGAQTSRRNLDYRQGQDYITNRQNEQYRQQQGELEKRRLDIAEQGVQQRQQGYDENSQLKQANLQDMQQKQKKIEASQRAAALLNDYPALKDSHLNNVAENILNGTPEEAIREGLKKKQFYIWDSSKNNPLKALKQRYEQEINPDKKNEIIKNLDPITREYIGAKESQSSEDKIKDIGKRILEKMNSSNKDQSSLLPIIPPMPPMPENRRQVATILPIVPPLPDIYDTRRRQQTA